MSALKDGRYEIELDKTRHLLFDLNVIDELNEKYGGYDKLGEILVQSNPKFLPDLKHILTMLLNEGTKYQNYIAGQVVEKPITEDILGMLVNPSMLNSTETVSAIYKAFNTGTTGTAKSQTTEDDDENPKIAATEPSLT